MVRITIAEDDPADLKQVTDCGLVFMDIELPVFNGVDVARQLREMDSVVTLVFITNMEQYAVNGYEVNALDFAVKPINYYRFSAMMHKALRIIALRGKRRSSSSPRGRSPGCGLLRSIMWRSGIIC